jgi:hypothetical protein
MKKFLALAVVAFTSLVVMMPSALAATATGTFNVVINLTGVCQLNTINDLTFNYTSFQVPSATPTSTFNVKCTNLLPYTVALDSTSITDNAVNLAYTLALSAGGGTGNGGNQSFTVNGTMAGGQSGDCATLGGVCTNATATNKTRTLTVTY